MKQYDVYDGHVQDAALQLALERPCKVIEYCFRFAKLWKYNPRLFYKDVVAQIEWNHIDSNAFA